MKAIITITSVVCLVANLAQAQNLLLNGYFNSQNVVTSSGGGENYGAAPDNWTVWTYSPGNDAWANRQVDNTSSFDGSFYMGLGSFGGAGDASGVYQTVSGTTGLTYDLTVESGVQNWWWPDGTMALSFLDGSGNVLGSASVLDVTTGITSYDSGLPWRSFDVNATAPTGTVQVKVEFSALHNSSTGGGGTVFFDNAVLTVVPEPSAMAVVAFGGIAALGWRRVFRRTN